MGHAQTRLRSQNLSNLRMVEREDCLLQSAAPHSPRSRVSDDRYWQDPEICHARKNDRRTRSQRRRRNSNSLIGALRRSACNAQFQNGRFMASPYIPTNLSSIYREYSLPSRIAQVQSPETSLSHRLRPSLAKLLLCAC